MRRVVFYSWQSDLPNSTNRGFIQRALEAAAAAIAGDDKVAVEPVIDRDTEGVAGSPDIAATIFAKIVAADVVVVDVSIINKTAGGRPTPNPNVLIELGYALKAVGYERVILAFNRSYGAIEDLPFDLRTRRILTYAVTEGEAEKAVARTDLSKRLDAALRAALAQVQEQDEPTVLAAAAAIESAKSNRILILRRSLAAILDQLDHLNPTKASDGGTVEELEAALQKSVNPVFEYSKIADAVAGMNDHDAAVEVFRWFGKLFERYHLPEGFSGRYTESDFDFFRFVGHELFVTLFACLLRERRLELMAELLQEPIPMGYLRSVGRSGNQEWSYGSQHVGMLGGASQRRGRASVHADLLNDRHTSSSLATIVPAPDFMAADFFLFLWGELGPTERGPHFLWRAWSTLNLKGAPAFILNAERKARAEELARALNVPSVEELKRRLAERGPELRRLFQTAVFWDYPISADNVARIGSR